MEETSNGSFKLTKISFGGSLSYLHFDFKLDARTHTTRRGMNKKTIRELRNE